MHILILYEIAVLPTLERHYRNITMQNASNIFNIINTIKIRIIKVEYENGTYFSV